MTIQKGAPWGAPGALARGAPVFADDADAARHLQDLFDGSDVAGGTDVDPALGEIGLIRGDLHRTLGGPGRDEAALRGGHGTRFPTDVGVVRIDGRDRVFLAHLVAYRGRRVRWFAGRTIAVMNAAFVGAMDLGPRSHPNDGRLDVTDGRLPLGQRRQGRRRARTGTHVPHPGLATRSVATFEEDLRGQSFHVWLDGVHAGTVERLSVRCIPDAVVVVA